MKQTSAHWLDVDIDKKPAYTHSCLERVLPTNPFCLSLAVFETFRSYTSYAATRLLGHRVRLKRLPLGWQLGAHGWPG